MLLKGVKLVKRVLIGVLLLFLMNSSLCLAKNRITWLSLLNNKHFSAGEVVSTRVLDLDKLRATGYFSLQVTITGGGVYTIKEKCSLDEQFFRTPEGVPDIATELTSTSGPESDGHLFIPVDLGAMTKYLQFEVVETSGTSGGTVTILLGITVDR